MAVALDTQPEPYMVHLLALNDETDEYEDFTLCNRSRVLQAVELLDSDHVNCPSCLEKL